MNSKVATKNPASQLYPPLKVRKISRYIEITVESGKAADFNYGLILYTEPLKWAHTYQPFKQV